ncbi:MULTISPECIES: hypothetical protein [unclassified Microcoleus]|uniref:hypothetical protein n=1 Tax=unclassified Microcoleus TaxID=2642155 RepID=UPI0025EAAF94|nr:MULTISPECIES: hypothetical protein [unclassified Microcoleus]
MELISTLLKVDLAVLTVILGIVGFLWKSIRDVKADAKADATDRAEGKATLQFYGKRLDSLENWRAAISEIRRSQ